MNKQRAEALVFRSGAPVEMVSAGAARPVSSKPASADQIRGLFSEVLGGSADDGYHTYKGPFGAVAITLQAAPGGGLTARVEPAPAEEAPLELATPAPAKAAAAPQVSGGTARGAPKTLDDLFHQMLDMKASDLHLKANKIPHVRVDGSIMAMPDRPVLCTMGDGGFSMVFADLETCVRRRIPFVTVVYNDSTLSLIQVAQQKRGYADYGVRYGAVDFAAASAALGAWSRRVATLDELAAAVAEARSLDVPAVIEVPIDPTEYHAHAR